MAELRHAPSLALIPLLITTIRVTARAETEIDLWGGCSEVRCDRVDGRMLVGADGLSAFPVSVGDLVGDVEDKALVVVELLGCGLARALGASEPPLWRWGATGEGKRARSGEISIGEARRFREGSRLGSAAYGVGNTPLEAAENAKAQYEGAVTHEAQDEGRLGEKAVVDKTGGITSKVSLGGSAEKTTIGPPSLVRERELGLPDVHRKIETLTGHGWRLWFEPEPDGTVTAHLLTWDSGEILKSAKGSDFHDAWLELGIDTTLPSEEVRRERQKRSES